MIEQEHVNTTSITIKRVQLFGRQSALNRKEPTAFEEFRESRNGRVDPATKFDVVCEIGGELDLSTEDFFLWTTVDFLVAPVTEALEKMGIDHKARTSPGNFKTGKVPASTYRLGGYQDLRD